MSIVWVCSSPPILAVAVTLPSVITTAALFLSFLSYLVSVFMSWYLTLVCSNFVLARAFSTSVKFCLTTAALKAFQLPLCMEFKYLRTAPSGELLSQPTSIDTASSETTNAITNAAGDDLFNDAGPPCMFLKPPDNVNNRTPDPSRDKYTSKKAGFGPKVRAASRTTP